MICRPDFKRYIATETLGAIITGASAVGSAGATAYANGKMNKRAEKFNREEAEKQRAFSVEMADKQNNWNYQLWKEAQEYDSPTNSVQRLRDAGLNPLYYGLDGSASPNAPQSAQPLGYERATAPNYANPVSSAIDSAVKVAQIANIQANTAKTNNESLTETQRREKLLADIDNAKQELLNMKAQEGLTKSQQSEIDKRISWMDRLNEATIAEKDANAKLSASQRKRIDELLENEKIIQSKTIQDFDERWNKIHAEIAKIAGENAILAKDLENYALNHANNGFMGTGLSLTNLIRGAKDVSTRPTEGHENKFSEGGISERDLINSGQ